MDPGPLPQMAHSTYVTLLHYVGNFRPQKLGPAPWQNPGSAPGQSVVPMVIRGAQTFCKMFLEIRKKTMNIS